jgi:hypothetical protein
MRRIVGCAVIFIQDDVVKRTFSCYDGQLAYLMWLTRQVFVF